MPKIGNTRKDKAAELFKRLAKGPDFGLTPGVTFTPEEARNRFQGWSVSWILEPLCELVPELRDLKWYDEAIRIQAIERMSR